MLASLLGRTVPNEIEDWASNSIRQRENQRLGLPDLKYLSEGEYYALHLQ